MSDLIGHPTRGRWRGTAGGFARRGALSVQERLERLRSRSFFIVQCGISAAVAWFIAGSLLGHTQPFFAPVAALVALGQSFGQRIERVVQIVVGVAVGVLVGDLFIHVFGTGYLQLAFIIIVAMALATLLDAGVLLTTQAGVQSAFVAILVPMPGLAFSRWTDAVVGGLVALTAATITPASPLRKPRKHAAAIVEEISQVLTAAATALRSRNIDDADAALARARNSEAALLTLEDLADDGLAVIRNSPFRRRHLPAVQAIADLLIPLDRAIRNIRVLVRRAGIAIRDGEDVPKAYIDLVDDLAVATRDMAGELEQRHLPIGARAALRDLGERTTDVDPHPSLSSEVIRAQVRSTVVDLLMVTGLSNEEALSYVPSSYSLETDDDPSDEARELEELATQVLTRIDDPDEDPPCADRRAAHAPRRDDSAPRTAGRAGQGRGSSP